MSPQTIVELRNEAEYHTLEEIAAKVFGSMSQGERISVSEAATKYMRFGSGSGHSTPWSAKKTPYLVEPMDVLSSLDYIGMIFVGPARTGKTAMSLGWLTHTVMTDPADMLYVHMDRENARKWSAGDLERFLLASPEVRAHQLTRREDDNTFDKQFDSGMRFLLTYPTASNLSGITVGRVWLIDYERMDDNVEGEGNPFDMAQKRTETFKRFGMTVAEASPNPNKEIADPKWVPSTPHEAPPIRGIFELYNRGDRRRLFWRCHQCGEPFEPEFGLLKGWEGIPDIMEAREAVHMVCPNHGCVLEPRMKDPMNMGCRWVPDGGMLMPDNSIIARPGMKIARSSIASFWMKGPAAAYQDWGRLVEKYIRAQKALEDTGDDAPLRATVTTDQGSYYIPASRLSERSPEQLRDKAEDWGSSEELPTVPHGVRFLIATVDVQKTSFVVQVNGFTATGDMVVVDGFKIRLSDRRNADGDRLPINPFAFAEDWKRLTDEVLLKTYPLADESGRRMRIRATGCDSGGGEGATAHAYSYWRSLKGSDAGLHRRLILIKGEASRTAPRARTTWPDASKKDKNSTARGDVPVLLLNSNSLKDQISAMMARRVGDETLDETSGGMLRYPNWMPPWFYNQLTTEVRVVKGWENPRSRRNEAFDLTYYAVGVAIRPVEQNVPWVHFGIERIDYVNPPIWASEWDANELVYSVGTSSENPQRKRVTFEQLGKDLSN